MAAVYAHIPALTPQLADPLPQRPLRRLPHRLWNDWTSSHGHMVILEYLLMHRYLAAGLPEEAADAMREAMAEMEEAEWPFPNPVPPRSNTGFWSYVGHLVDEKLVKEEPERIRAAGVRTGIPFRITDLGVAKVDFEQRLVRCHCYAQTVRHMIRSKWPRVGREWAKEYLWFKDAYGQKVTVAWDELPESDWLTSNGRARKSFFETIVRHMPQHIVGQVSMSSVVHRRQVAEKGASPRRFWSHLEDPAPVQAQIEYAAAKKKARLYYDPCPQIDWITSSVGDWPMMDSPYLLHASLSGWEKGGRAFMSHMKPYVGGPPMRADGEKWLRRWPEGMPPVTDE